MLAAKDSEPANGYQKRRRETRRLLVEAGRALFEQSPLEQVSIERITDYAGVAKGSFYNHFATRDALFDEVTEGALTALLAPYDAADVPVQDQLQFAAARANLTFYTLLSNPGTCKLLMQGGQPTRGGPIDRVLHSMLGDKLASGVALGRLNHLDTELVYAAYFGVVTSAIGHLLMHSESLDPASASDSLTQLCFAVLGLPPPLPPYDVPGVAL